MHRPVFRPAECTATVDEVVELAAFAFDRGVLPRPVERMMRATGVETRSFVRPAKTVFTTGSGPELWEETADLLAAMAREAAERALAAAGLAPEQIDALVLSSVSGWSMPGVDARLIRSLGLRPTVRRLPVSVIGCAGGLYGLIRAREQVAAQPDARVLVVATEAFSIGFQPRNTSTPSMIYKALGGDGAAAVVVTSVGDARPGPAVELRDPFELLVPDTEDDYRMTADPRTGHLGFTSTAEAPQALLKAEQYLAAWRGRPGAGPGAGAAAGAAEPASADPTFFVAHHGGPAILDRTAQVLGCDREQLRHSWESLRRHGNMTSVSVLDILARTLDDPDGPRPGEEGLMLAIGPGVTIAAARLRRALPAN
ncbi:3-oxoacyl-[acyl-carrier-protein] synthase III C-terminal domain-containing protein [Streptacidiphilus fuscans]|uniref:PhlD n=1 Tax=Streptacidiphilus fuscans TaxID=2789292 RepID=A0A931BB30_9ACTN|nr:3-oxoacyl-[acyl-carrier-protein] synthase III C-terminal domain-containing protein [Streptacidiphilus fuscans]MBF9071967.1 PhlD [Streptacidiphilus fuscans]